jgi:hypothetical protein
MSNESAAATKSFTRFIPHIARVLMALPFLVAGLNGFLNFIPQPKEPMSENATLMLTAFMKSG